MALDPARPTCHSHAHVHVHTHVHAQAYTGAVLTVVTVLTVLTLHTTHLPRYVGAVAEGEVTLGQGDAALGTVLVELLTGSLQQHEAALVALLDEVRG